MEGSKKRGMGVVGNGTEWGKRGSRGEGWVRRGRKGMGRLREGRGEGTEWRGEDHTASSSKPL